MSLAMHIPTKESRVLVQTCQWDRSVSATFDTHYKYSNNWHIANNLSISRPTTPNASLIETHVNCLNSTGRFHYFLLYEPYSVAYQDKALNVLV